MSLGITDIERPQAGKTDYAGKLKSKKLGFTIMFLATSYRGRAIPFSFITYSSRTIGAEISSRNMEHIKSVEDQATVLTVMERRDILSLLEFGSERTCES